MKAFKHGGLIKAWTEGVPVEDGAWDQIGRVAELPFVEPWVAAMPDVHIGMGATIGSVIPTNNVLIPAAVGVDIGCGMRAVRIKNPPNMTASAMRFAIEKAVPHGRTNNGGLGDRGAWGNIPSDVQEAWEEYLEPGYLALIDKNPEFSHNRPVNQLGTLGTGNHFIEVCTSDKAETWLVIHSGSRGAGARIASVSIRAAKALMKKFYIELEDPSLAYLPEGTIECAQYVMGMMWALEYAKWNRNLMMLNVVKALDVDYYPASCIDCHHNFAQRERHYGKMLWITRKGATRAGLDDQGIIPGNMGAKSYIFKGMGNRESFSSCSHGAGRTMSRTAARQVITIEDHLEATKGVECRKDEGVLDESSKAYKDIDAVMAAQDDLIEVVHTLKQFVNVKG